MNKIYIIKSILYCIFIIFIYILFLFSYKFLLYENLFIFFIYLFLFLYKFLLYENYMYFYYMYYMKKVSLKISLQQKFKKIHS